MLVARPGHVLVARPGHVLVARPGHVLVARPGHAGMRGNDPADRLAGKATLTSG